MTSFSNRNSVDAQVESTPDYKLIMQVHSRLSLLCNYEENKSKSELSLCAGFFVKANCDCLDSILENNFVCKP